MKWRKSAWLFCVGGGSYVGLELLYRRRSHISMFCAGGICFLLLGNLRRKRCSLPVKAILGMLQITAVEYVTGLIVNKDYLVWDYRSRRGNFRGQICPAFSLLWLPVSMLAMGLYGQLDRFLEKGYPESG